MDRLRKFDNIKKEYNVLSSLRLEVARYSNIIQFVIACLSISC